ncbi:MAG: hypothetical protein AB8C46_19690 [Burkholderiaceae bacterium]
MNTKTNIAAIAIFAAFSSSAFAGELYNGLDSSLTFSQSTILSSVPVQSTIASDGEVYAAAESALDSFQGSAAARVAPVTSLAVGGELGAPVRDGFSIGNINDESAFAE